MRLIRGHVNMLPARSIGQLLKAKPELANQVSTPLFKALRDDTEASVSASC